MSRHQHPSTATPATTALARLKVDFTVHPYTHDPAAPSYGLEAAEALGVDPARVFKTLLVEVDRTLVVGIVPVTGSLDLKALAAAAGGKKARMAEPAVAERVTGYVIGGISPVGGRRKLPTFLDSSAGALGSVLVSGGRRGLDIELATADLLVATEGRLAPIARSGTGPVE